MSRSWSDVLLLLVVMLSLAGCGGTSYPRSVSGDRPAPAPSVTAAPSDSGMPLDASAQTPVSAQPLTGQTGAGTAPRQSVAAAQPLSTPRASASSSTTSPSYQVGGNRSALASGMPAFAAIRPGDVIEVRFYRNTPLETKRYDLGVGDIVGVDVFGFPELSRERIIVLPDGFISVPLVGSLRAAGKNVDEIGLEISQKLEAEQILDPQVSVAVVETDRRREALLDRDGGGGVRPASRITVSEAGYLNLPYIAPLSVTGLSVADMQTLVRGAYGQEFGGRVEVTANLISRTAPAVFVMGEVTTPSRIELTGPFNPLMAIAAAGGFTVRAEPEEVRVVRIRANGTYQQYPFNLDASLEGQSNAGADFRLMPQDVVFVPPSGIADANTWVDQWIRQMIPISFGTGFSIN